ncbi:aldehyde dehydrogenase family protein [Mesorhizobium koreense]|uniref:aldehyde dehydrogenase family protein n=1 Tax=Mesorhizobium koreense TaxID=3074855 RepID=UPI00287B6C01|nr:aldehyde dehydrogenase family protein [Mesorhizobium sp. WR6]
MFQPDLIIGGSRGRHDCETFDRVNPVSGAVASRAASASVDDANAAADAAQAAFAAWASLGPSDRRARLNAVADVIVSRHDGFVERMVAETGSTRGWASYNVHEGANMFREAAAMVSQIKGEVIPTNVPGNLSMAVRQAAGVCLGIAPWNAPIILGARAMAMPLACGNTVVLKTSEVCPAVHGLLGACLVEAGLDAGQVNVVHASAKDTPAVISALIEHASVRRINFTGSTRVGRIIALQAAALLKPVLLELGGKSPMVVLESADLDKAADAAIFGAFMNQGQICMSTERIVVDRTIAAAFVEKFSARALALSAKDPAKGEAQLGAMVSEAAAQRIDDLVADAATHGASIISKGARQGTVMQATIVDKVTSAMRIYAEESFGPVTTVVHADDLADAIRIANDTEYGLSASVFGEDIGQATWAAAQLQSGICHINGPTVHDEPQMPFGGTKNSGFGRFGGTAGIDAFTELRWISIQTGARHYPI